MDKYQQHALEDAISKWIRTIPAEMDPGLIEKVTVYDLSLEGAKSL